MRKTYKSLVALAVMLLGAISVNAQVQIDLTPDMMFQWDGWGAGATQIGPSESCAYNVGMSTDMPYGDSRVIDYADLSAYDKLIVTAIEGTPRFLLNRDIDEGQWKADESASHLIDNTQNGWSNRYFSSTTTEEGTAYTVDLKLLTKEKGFAHLHAIKGANWANVTVTSMILERNREGAGIEFCDDAIQIFFEYDTNLSELVKAGGRQRLLLPTDCVQVTANGSAKSVLSVEGYTDGRLYIFLEDLLNRTDNVEVTFNNPSDAAYHLVYAAGPSYGADVQTYTATALYNPGIYVDDVYPYDLLIPAIKEADPENGSFGLPNSISEFHVTFDKVVDCAALQADINGETLTVSPSEGFAERVTLNHSGTFADGAYTIHLTKIYPLVRMDDTIFGDTTIVVNIGAVDQSSMPQEIVSADLFNNCPAGAIPDGYFVRFGAEDRPANSSYGSGSRMFDFAAGGDFTKGLYYREGYVEYGTSDGRVLPLEAGKKYIVHFNTAMWKSSGTNTRFEILTEGGDVAYVQVIANKPDVNGVTSSAVNGSTVVDVEFVPEASGNYVLRWTSSNAETGDPAYMENLLANVNVKYMPEVAGLEYIMMLNNALENARKALTDNSDSRYSGSAYDALNALVATYDGQSFTAPSKYLKAVADLEAGVKAMKDHRANCDKYDESIKKAIDVVRQNRENKFGATELYAQVSGIVDKYQGTSEWVNMSQEEGVEQWQLFYSFNQLTDDQELLTAAAELTDIANMASLLFTEGESAVGSANGGKATGVAVLIDRLRLGAEALKSLGVAEDNWFVTAALNSLTDDDELAEGMKNFTKQVLYGQLKDADNTLFATTINEQTLEEVTPQYDMTIFVKNPNIYKQLTNLVFTQENVPGWITPEGYAAPGLTTGWNAPVNVEGVAEDCMFQTWAGSYRVEQTITDMPAGVYTVAMGFGERGTESDLDGSFVYANTSAGTSVQMGDELFTAATAATVIGQAFPFANARMEGLVITDGMLTIGVNGGPTSHTFFNDVRIYMTGAANGFDYGAAWIQGIDQTEATRVKAIELFDLNGRRISQARQGVVIVKKIMTDGTVTTEKVVKK